tara:strand:- start:1722 stop:2639 length:918 start_codon:yes stop_codon:yes gene_type:complete
MDYSLEQLFNKIKLIPMQPVAQTVNWLLISLSVYCFAEVTWKLIPDHSERLTWEPIALGSKKASHVNLNQMALDDFFGQYVEGELPASGAISQAGFEDAPPTTLNIRLTGLIASENERRSLAIIESEGKEQIYVINDQIIGTPAQLVKIFPDRVIVAYSDKSETLMLDGVEYSRILKGQSNKTPHSSGNVKKTGSLSAETVKKLRKQRQEFINNPSKIAEFISIIPYKVNGELLGYRLMPRKNKELFLEAGLKPNDLAKSINGYNLLDMSESVALMKEVRNLQEFTVVVERDGQLVSISVDFAQN